MVCSQLDEKSCLGKFNFRLFSRLEENGGRVAGYLSDGPLEFPLSLSGARHISAEIFCSESLLYEAVKTKLDSDAMKDLMLIINDSEVMRSYFRITDRMMSTPRSIYFRGHLLRLSVAYWLMVINELKITAVWFSSTPHFGFDTLLALMSNRLGIKVFIPHRTEYETLHLVSNGISSEEYLRRLVRTPLQFKPTWITYSRRLIFESLSYNRQLDHFFMPRLLLFFRLLRSITGAIRLKVVNPRWHRQFSPIYMTNNRLSTYFSALAARARQSRRLWNEYSSVSSTTLPEVYVFFPWSFQPERTTDPEAGKFADLEFCVHYLLAELPRNWSLVVKEHPRQFDGPSIDIRKLHFRAEGVYQRLGDLNRVFLANLSIDSTELARKAMGCVTTTGSIGFEALSLGGRVGCFGRPWYAGLRYCYSIDTVEGLRVFFNSLQSQEVTDQTENFERRVQDYLRDYSFVMPSFNSKDEDFSSEGIENMVDTLASALFKGDFSTLEEKIDGNH